MICDYLCVLVGSLGQLICDATFKTFCDLAPLTLLLEKMDLCPGICPYFGLPSLLFLVVYVGVTGWTELASPSNSFLSERVDPFYTKAQRRVLFLMFSSDIFCTFLSRFVCRRAGLFFSHCINKNL